MAIFVVGAAFSSSSCGGDGVHWAAFHGALNNVDSAASSCSRALAANNRGQPVPIFGLLARPERSRTNDVDASRQAPPATPRPIKSLTKPQPYEASASARAASSAKKTRDSRDGGRIRLKEDRMDAALRAAISTMGEGGRAGRSSSL